MRKFLLKWRNRLIAFLSDLIMVPIAWLSGYWLFYDLHEIPMSPLIKTLFCLIPIMIFQALLFWLCGLYRGVWRFASIPDLLRITKAIAFGTSTILLICLIFKNSLELPRVIPLLYGLLLGIGLCSTRILFRWLKDYRHFFTDSKRVLIVGAGYAGERLIRDLLRDENHTYQPVIIVDDNEVKIGRDIHGIRVKGNCQQIGKFVHDYNIDLILIAIPSASSAEMRRIVELCSQTNIPSRTLPGINDLTNGRVDIKLLRHVSLEDLLGRDQVSLDWESIGENIKDQIVLISGGGGSIGSELCRQIANLHPKKLIIVDNCEFNLYLIDMELKNKYPLLDFHIALLDITDRQGLEIIFATFSPGLVFHAAAYKHVPLLEKHIRAAVHNNILGTNTLANISVAFGVSKFIFISTDKAVNPTNFMGATKRCAEMICQNLYGHSLTKFITVRFGNVLDSAGSVLPLFRKQIQEGGPITVTHPDITRYFMSIPEASQLILQAAMLGEGGEIFVLEMGQPVKILYLAEQMCKLAGKTIGKDIEIVYTGLRPGEKLYEELFYKNEELHPTVHHKILQAKACTIDKNTLLNFLEKIESAYAQSDETKLYASICQIVPEYKKEEGLTSIVCAEVDEG